VVARGRPGRRAHLYLVARRQFHRMNVAYHELMNGGRTVIRREPGRERGVRHHPGGQEERCVILGGGSPKNFYLQGQPTSGGLRHPERAATDYFIQFTTDQVVWGGSRAPRRPRR